MTESVQVCSKTNGFPKPAEAEYCSDGTSESSFWGNSTAEGPSEKPDSAVWYIWAPWEKGWWLHSLGLTHRASVGMGVTLYWIKFKLGGYRWQENDKMISQARKSEQVLRQGFPHPTPHQQFLSVLVASRCRGTTRMWPCSSIGGWLWAVTVIQVDLVAFFPPW